MADQFAGFLQTLDSPAAHAFAVTTSDSSDLSTAARALYVGTGGDIKVTTIGGETVTFTSVAAGFFPIRVSRVFATGTTATGIIAVW
jgi:hypothetical protein